MRFLIPLALCSFALLVVTYGATQMRAGVPALPLIVLGLMMALGSAILTVKMRPPR